MSLWVHSSFRDQGACQCAPILLASKEMDQFVGRSLIGRVKLKDKGPAFTRSDFIVELFCSDLGKACQERNLMVGLTLSRNTTRQTLGKPGPFFTRSQECLQIDPISSFNINLLEPVQGFAIVRSSSTISSQTR